MAAPLGKFGNSTLQDHACHNSFNKVAVEKSTQTNKNPTKVMAQALALDLCYEFTRNRVYAKYHLKSEIADTLKRLVKKLIHKHGILLSSMPRRLNFNADTGIRTFTAVANEVFDEKGVSWSRIVTLYAFGVQLVKYCKDNNMEDYALDISRFVGIYVGEKTSDWIHDNGGWDALVQAFPPENELEVKFWKGLLALGIGLGLTAVAIHIWR